MILKTTLATSFTVGTNLKGQVADANWLFLLPNLNLERTVCLGMPPLGTLKALARLSQEVIVVGPGDQQVKALSQESDLANIVFTRLGALLPLPDSTADLIVVPNGAWWLWRNPATWVEVQRLLKREGFMYFELGGLVKGPWVDKLLSNRAKGLGTTNIFWLTPTTGKMQTAVPLSDRTTINYFIRRQLYSPSFNLKVFDQAERFLHHRPFFSHLIQRRGVLARRTRASSGDQPPQYLRLIAQGAGIDIDDYRWGLSARGRYNSRKVLFFLFSQASGSPEYIVKMTRDPIFNSRLENEYYALKQLQEQGISQPETLPQAVFLGHHNNLAIVGETMVEGAPFRQRSQANANCPYAQAAIDWLTHLARATANPTAATSAQVADVFKILLTRFIETYSLSLEEYTFLNSQIATLERSPTAIPLVFQHGDSGTWNLIVTQAGRVVFLDWEAAETQGMPLWDLFYFLRSFNSDIARTRGTRDGLTAFTQQLLTESPINSLMVEATRRYCEQVCLPGYLVEPLFYTCWLHRALKEATRLPAAKVEQGHYVNLLKLCIDQRSAPALQRLFSFNP